MKVMFKQGRNSIQKTVKKGNVILSNGKNFLNLGYANSKYQGFFISKELRFFKILEEILVEGEIKRIEYDGTTVTRVKKNGKEFSETFSLQENSLVYTLDQEQELTLVFDVRGAGDFSTEGRSYTIYEEGKKTIIEYAKDGLNVVINTTGFEKIDNWAEYNYTVDEKRNSTPYTWHVYQALRGKFKGKMVITAGFFKDECIVDNKYTRKKSPFKVYKWLSNMEEHISYNFAANSLRSLQNKYGLFAGLPWFYQNWTRDEMISLKGLYLIDKKKALELLVSRLSYVHNGRLPNRFPHADLGSADSIGWFFLRVDENLDKFTKAQRELITKKVKEAVDHIIQVHYSGMVFNDKLETWMDTHAGEDFRKGFRIEIQALFLRMLSLAYKLTREKQYRIIKADLLQHVKANFFKDGYLYDGFDDPTIRPNVFLAYYAFPDLLTKKEWESCFDKVLKKLWLSWGGLSTIQTDSPLFTPNYTGENNKSYHRGDSWYWVNNMAAICMKKVNAAKFKKYIEKIKQASVKDILWQGAFGSASEVSSASEQTASGCFNQAWSNALFLELLNSR